MRKTGSTGDGHPIRLASLQALPQGGMVASREVRCAHPPPPGRADLERSEPPLRRGYHEAVLVDIDDRTGLAGPLDGLGPENLQWAASKRCGGPGIGREGPHPVDQRPSRLVPDQPAVCRPELRRVRSPGVVLWDGGGPPRREVVEGLDQQAGADRSEEHTSELQSRENLVCRLLLE